MFHTIGFVILLYIAAQCNRTIGAPLTDIINIYFLKLQCQDILHICVHWDWKNWGLHLQISQLLWAEIPPPWSDGQLSLTMGPSICLLFAITNSPNYTIFTVNMGDRLFREVEWQRPACTIIESLNFVLILGSDTFPAREKKGFNFNKQNTKYTGSQHFSFKTW